MRCHEFSATYKAATAHRFLAGIGYAFFFAFFHRARAAFFARFVFSAAVMPFAVFAPPCCPRHTGQYSTTTSSVSGWMVQCFAIGCTRYHW